MASHHALQGREAANAAIEALRKNRRDKAAEFFDEAFDHFEAIPDIHERREELGPFALLLNGAGFPDLSMIAAQEAIALDKQTHHRRHLAEDLVTCGNAHLQLGNLDDARRLYQEALDICVENGDLDNAASASTNIAIIAGNTGDMPKAIELLYRSLDFLASSPHRDTEIITRIALTQALESTDGDPEEIFAVAGPVARFSAHLRPDQWDGLRGPLEQTVERFLRTHPRLDGPAVKREYLAGLF